MRSLHSAAGVMVALEPERTLEALTHLLAAAGSYCGNLLFKLRFLFHTLHAVFPRCIYLLFCIKSIPEKFKALNEDQL